MRGNSVRYVQDEDLLKKGDLLVLQQDRREYSNDHKAGDTYRFNFVIKDGMLNLTSIKTGRVCKFYTNRFRRGGSYGPIAVLNGCIFDD